MKGKYDMLWKSMLEEVFEDLLRFVDPEIEKKLDIGRGFEFMDKELAAINPEPGETADTRVVDKLVKVYLRNGGETWMLLHVEVQGENEAGFAKRMFRYYYRLLDRKSLQDKDVAALAILTGRYGKKVPDKYERRTFWGGVLYNYKTLCITDYSNDVLKASDNPFAIVMMVAKEALTKRPKNNVDEKEKKREEEIWDQKLLKQKLLIVKLLYREATFTEDKVRAILVFLNNYVAFNKQETNRIFMEQIDVITGKKDTMGIIEQVKQIRLEEAREVGREEGLKTGRKEGRDEERRLFVENLLKDSDFAPEKIASVANVSLEYVNEVKVKLRAKK